MDLQNIRVLDLTRLLPGPFASQLLTDLGAEVIKVEDPKVGDYAREVDPQIDGMSVGFAMVNRGKKAITLDLKTDEGKGVFYGLVEEADVVFEQFRPGVVDRLGIDYEDLQEYNEDIVYCSLSGYGQSGPCRDWVGHDLNYVGLAGLLDMTRKTRTADPVIPGYPVADMVGGLFAAFGILGAVAAGDHENGGRYLDVAMADAVLSLSHAVTARALVGEDPRPRETALTGQFPWYGVYRTADDRFITFAANESKFWEEFCRTIDRKDLVEYHLTENKAELAALREQLTEEFLSRTSAEWEELADENNIMVAPVRTPREAVDDRHFRDRGMVLEGTYPRLNVPILADGLRGETTPPPRQGEHTDQILKTHGLSEERIEELRQDDVL